MVVRVHRGSRRHGRAAAGVIVDRPAQVGGQEGRRRFYLMNPHQTAKAAVAKMTVRAIERSNESAASLIQSITDQNFPVGSIGRVSQLCRDFFRKAMALSRSTRAQFFIGALTPAAARCGTRGTNNRRGDGDDRSGEFTGLSDAAPERAAGVRGDRAVHRQRQQRERELHEFHVWITTSGGSPSRHR